MQTLHFHTLIISETCLGNPNISEYTKNYGLIRKLDNLFTVNLKYYIQYTSCILFFFLPLNQLSLLLNQNIPHLTT